MQQSVPLNFVISFCKEMIPGSGEDSYCYSFCDSAGMLGVFDGCGGAGAKKHNCYSGKSEAFVASRLVAGAFFDSFRQKFPTKMPSEQVASEIFKPTAMQRLNTFGPDADGSGLLIKGSMVRTLPTTAAVALVRRVKSNLMEVSAIWAGDSRVYVLDANGLAQLTVDDTSVADPMDNLYEDGVLRNIFCSDRDVELHCKTVQVRTPFVVLAATDGCFGYVTTPMEFEGMILHSLLNADNPEQWETNMAQIMGQSAGDDHTLCLATIGYSSFRSLQKNMSKRYAQILDTYLNPVSALPPEDRASRQKLWETYRGSYMRYLEGSTK